MTTDEAFEDIEELMDEAIAIWESGDSRNRHIAKAKWSEAIEIYEEHFKKLVIN